MGEGIRGLERLRRSDAHNLSRGISALENIAAEDHGDYDTWMGPSQSVRFRVDFFCCAPAERNTICTVSGTWNAYTQLLRSEPVVSRRTWVAQCEMGA